MKLEENFCTKIFLALSGKKHVFRRENKRFLLSIRLVFLSSLEFHSWKTWALWEIVERIQFFATEFSLISRVYPGCFFSFIESVIIETLKNVNVKNRSGIYWRLKKEKKKTNSNFKTMLSCIKAIRCGHSKECK